ncbi:succinyl-diaminopimelate desuccinylase [Helicobacter monodelphidis]|uniref:succinyl-diaminopimelate desuccinylase n=1 Tax=Helicobacter sp. 15-1451 TaxID=2004995 RepID=UPI000DCBDF15|nr:succinyl-diaminopimelate desuccinylase [Helicobacter sp. 15-1451]RAX57244.1 succinyl-diaminopimelate desuccinylase [Helicobacter sp. 15-1451]
MQTSIEILRNLVRKKSITPDEAGIYDYIKSLLPHFKHHHINKEGVQNLYSCYDGGGDVHLCFAGHIDVVNEGSGWSVDPFLAEQKDGYIYGRGTQDMKSGVAAFVSVLQNEEFLRDFKGKISMILTSDEEGDAVYGTQEVLKYLKIRNELPHYAVVAEPTAEKWVGDTIKVGRRGSINGTLVIHGIQGHVAYPGKCDNPVERIAPVLSQIAGFNLDSGDEHFEPSKIVVTDIRGGLEVVNVTPSELKVMFNVRNSTKSNKESLQKHLETILAGIPHKLTLKASSFAFLTQNDSEIIQTLKEVLEKKYQKSPILSTGGGTSDAKYFAAFGVSVVECGVCNDRIHAVDERVSEKEVLELEEIFYALIQRMGEK